MSRLSALLLFVLALPVLAQQPPTPQQLLDAVHKSADLSAAGPYTLTATVIGNPGRQKAQQSGQLRIDRDHDRFRVQLDMPGYREIRLTLGDKTYVPRTKATLLATGLSDLDHIWDPLWRRPGLEPLKPKYEKPRRETVRGIEALCFDEKDKSGKTRLCLDPARSVLLSKDEGRYGRTEYARYNSFSGHLVPGRVEIRRPNIQKLVLEDIHVQFQAVDAARFAIPEDSVELETCEGLQHPRPVFTPSPNLAMEARKAPMHGRLLLRMLISATGRVDDVELLNPSGDSIDANAKSTVHTWKFKPATCAGHAVASEMMVDMDFSTY